MSKRNAKPYSNYNNRDRNSRNNARTTNYNSKNRNKVNNITNKKPVNKELEYTTRIRIDQERINDFETLDTSFLEGRLDKKVKKNKKNKERLLAEKKEIFVNLKRLKNALLVIALLCFVVLFLLIIFNNDKSKPTENKTVNIVEKNKIKDTVDDSIDDNYLFVGDVILDKWSFEDLDYHYVKVSDKEFTTEDIKDDLNNYIYKYNPSIVFIQLGLNDLNQDKSINEIGENIEKIVDGIKKNRPYAEIYLESVCPINKNMDDYDDDMLSEEVTNSKIKDLNKKIKSIAADKDINYLDLFDVLSKDDKLKKDYTENGVYLNDEGYSILLKEINKIVG